MSKQCITEEELIRRCKQADPLAQRYLYELYAGRFLGICKRYFNNLHQAEDAMINSFVKIFAKISSFRSEGSFEGWLKRIVVNECLGEIRKKQLMFVEADVQSEKIDNQLANAQETMQVEELLTMVHQLPDGYRTVFNLYAIEGYSHQEIGEMLGISEGTSKSQLSRARNILQKYIEIHNQEKSTLQYNKNL